MTVAWGDTDIDYNLSGDTASRPAANTVEAGSTYANTETGVLYEQILGSWIAIADLSGVVGSPTYNGLDDVDMTGLVGGNFARWDAGLSMWKPVTIAASDLGSGASSAKFFRGDMTWSDTLTGPLNVSGNGALSAPGLKLSGTWITGGTATTTKPYALIEPAGATSTAWSTAGTGLGLNAASGFAGNLMDLQLNGLSMIRIAAVGPSGAGAPALFFAGNQASNGLSLALPTDIWGYINRAATGTGGMYIFGTSSDPSGTGLSLVGHLGSVSPTVGISAVKLTASKSNGGTWVADLAATDIALALTTSGGSASTNNLFSVLGDGTIRLGLTGDLFIARGGANIMDLRNGTAAQELRVYGTYANGGVDYERFVIRTAAGNYIIGQEIGGTGAARALEIRTGGVTALTIGTDLSATFAGKAITVLSATGGAGFNLPHGAAPTSPVDGDLWTTTAGLFVRINGVTKTVTLL